MKITEIFTYPVKSLGGYSMPTAHIALTGLDFDRQWIVVQNDGTMMTQRIFPQMALIETKIENEKLVLSSFGLEPLIVEPNIDESNRIKTNVWGDDVNAVEYDAITNEWLSQALDSPCKLAGFPKNEPRQCDENFSNYLHHGVGNPGQLYLVEIDPFQPGYLTFRSND